MTRRVGAGVGLMALVAALPLVGCGAPPGLRSAAEVEMSFPTACARRGGMPVPADNTRVVDASGFSVTLPEHGWCRVDAGGLSGFVVPVLSPQEIAERGGRLTPAERSHSAFVAAAALARGAHGAALRSPAGMRRALVAAAAPGGQDAAGERLLPLSAGGRFRLVSVEVGALRPDGCVPVRTEVEERDNPVMPPGAVLRLRDERRYCVGPGGRGAAVTFSERFDAADPDAEARGARVRALAERVFDSLRFEAPAR